MPAWLNIASIPERRNLIAFERSLYVQIEPVPVVPTESISYSRAAALVVVRMGGGGGDTPGASS